MSYGDVQVAFKGLEPYSLNGVTVTDQTLGIGSYATVLKLDYLGLKCAGKKIHELLLGLGSDAVTYTLQRFKDECIILSQVCHPNIVQFLGVFFQPGDHVPILVMELLPLNLDQCIDKHKLIDETRYSILHDVALGLHYLHNRSSPIVHRDLSSNNVLLTPNMTAKISDLGVARMLNLSPQKVTTHLTKAPGTPAFMPPEVMVEEPKYNTSVDIFSYGVLMIHVFSGKWPVPQIGQIRTEGSRLIPVSEAERREPFLQAIGSDHPLIHLIHKCINNNPKMRANTSEIVDQLARMVEEHPTQFTNQLDMMEYIRRLEERNEELETENRESKDEQMMQNAKQTRAVISKLERKQEVDQTQMQTLLHTMEKAIDEIKVSLNEEVNRVANHQLQSTTHELDELKRELTQAETQAVSSQVHVSRREKRYENTLPDHRQKSGAAKSKHTLRMNVSDTEIQHDSKSKAKKPAMVRQAKEQQENDPKSIPVLQEVESRQRQSSLQPTSDIGGTGEGPIDSGTAAQLAIDNKSSAADTRSVSVTDTSSKGSSKPPPLPAKPKHLQAAQTKSVNTSPEKKKDLTSSTRTGKEKASKGKDEGRRRSRSEADHTDPKMDAHQSKKKPFKIRNLFSSKTKEEKDKPVAGQPSAEPSKSEGFESSGSFYDMSLLGASSQELATTESSMDDLTYPIYTARFDYNATSASELSFKEGDQMHIKGSGDGKTWHASLNGREGNIPKSYVKALGDEEWFFGKMDSTTARNFIMTSSNGAGSFLVRQNKKTGIFSVTVRDQDKPRNYRIYKGENGMLYASLKRSFRSIYDLVQYHSRNAAGLCTTLAKPCIVPHCITDQNEVIFDEKLATGQFSEVWKGVWKGEVVVVNKVTLGSVTGFDLLDKCAFLKTVNHENLIQFRAVHMNSEPLLVITENTMNGSLKEYLPSQSGSKDFKMAQLIKISEQVASAMKYLEEHNCIHQELAAKNVMIEVEEEEKMMIKSKLSIYPYVHKVTEYGASYDAPVGSIPIRWSSHEAIVNNQINVKSNVWSYGILVWEIVQYCRSYPYPETSEAGVLEKLKQGYRMPRPMGCPHELYGLILDCWKEDANSRPTFEQLHQQMKIFYTSDSFGYEEIEFK